MENKFAAIFAEMNISDRIQADLMNLGFSRCLIRPSLKNAADLVPLASPDLIIVEFNETDESSFTDLKDNVQNHHLSIPILFIADEIVAKKLAAKGLLKRSHYITRTFTFRELELCIDALLIQFQELKTLHTWFDQSRLISLFNILPNGIIICDSTGRILSANNALTKILGYTHEEFCTMHLNDLVLQEGRELLKKNIGRILDGDTIRSEVVNICKNGETKNLELIETKILLSNGKDGFLIISSDITHWKAINNALAESEEKYRILVEKSNDGIVFSQDGILVYANPKIAEMLGTSSDELIGKPFYSYFNDREKDAVIERYKRRQEGNAAPEIYETLIQRVDGNSIPVEFNVNMAHYRGKPTTMVFIRDISKRKLSEKYIKESEESYRSVFDNASEAIYIQDSRGVFLDVNKAALKLYGYHKSEIVGSTPEMLSAPGRNNMDAAINGLIAAFEGKTQIFEFWGISKTGRVFPKEVILNKGKYFGADVVFAMARDISDRKNAEAILMESEEKYRTLTEQIPVGIYRTSETGDIYYANPAMAQIVGFDDVDEFLTHNVNEFFAETEERLGVIRLVRESQGYIQSEFTIVRNDGKRIWIRDNSKANYDSQGNLLFFDGVIENITEQKEATEALQRSEANLRATLNAIPDLMFKFNRNGVFLDLNAYNKDAHDVNPETLQGRSIFDYYTAEHCNNFIQNINRCLENGTLQTFEYEISTSGNINYFEARMIPVGADEVLSFSRNITDRKIAEQDLIRAKERAEESDRLKSAFLANMSHEIRSPMNAILGFIRIIKEEEILSDNGKQYIDLISNSGAQLVSVIEDILDTSKIQANQLRLSIREFDLNALLIELFTSFSAQVKEKHQLNTILLPPVLPGSSPFLINSDDMRIRQILTNLLSNAIKFTSKGIIEFGYSIIIDDENPRIQVFVKDTGIGLPPDALSLIFERFRQADDSYTRMYGGSGLGLAISKGLIELLGGEIWVESQAGKGSTFYFTLPFGGILSEERESLDITDTPDFVKFVGALNWSNKTILIVEDMQDIQYFLKRVLLKTGVTLLFADSLKEARAIFQSSKKIDLILLDIRLPDGDGYGLSVEFKAQKPRIPIIAQTAYAMQGEKEKSQSFGCDDFITKPILPNLLFLKIDSLLRRWN